MWESNVARLPQSRKDAASTEDSRTTMCSRRSFLRRSALGIGPAALAALLSNESRAADLHSGVIAQPHHPPRVKRVIHLCMAGGPSHLETFDEKPLHWMNQNTRFEPSSK